MPLQTFFNLPLSSFCLSLFTVLGLCVLPTSCTSAVPPYHSTATSFPVLHLRLSFSLPPPCMPCVSVSPFHLIPVSPTSYNTSRVMSFLKLEIVHCFLIQFCFGKLQNFCFGFSKITKKRKAKNNQKTFPVRAREVHPAEQREQPTERCVAARTAPWQTSWSPFSRRGWRRPLPIGSPLPR